MPLPKTQIHVKRVCHLPGFPPLAEPQTTHSVTGISWLRGKLSMPASAGQTLERGRAWKERKVWQSDVVLLTGNIRRRPLQINVEQVLGV